MEDRGKGAEFIRKSGNGRFLGRRRGNRRNVTLTVSRRKGWVFKPERRTCTTDPSIMPFQPGNTKDEVVTADCGDVKADRGIEVVMQPFQKWVTSPAATGDPSKAMHIIGTSRGERLRSWRVANKEFIKSPVDPESIKALA